MRRACVGLVKAAPALGQVSKSSDINANHYILATAVARFDVSFLVIWQLLSVARQASSDVIGYRLNRSRTEISALSQLG